MYFWYEKTLMGTWSANLSVQSPHQRHHKFGPKVAGLVDLGEQTVYPSLKELMQKYPAPAPEYENS